MSDCPKVPQSTSGRVNSAEGDSGWFVCHMWISYTHCVQWLSVHFSWKQQTLNPVGSKKSFLCLGLSTAGSVSKQTILQFFLLLPIFPPVKRKEPQEGNGCAGLPFHTEELDTAELCCTHWSHAGIWNNIFLLASMQLSEGINAGQGLGIEIIATFQLVLCVLATTDRRRNDVSGSAPLAIGLSVALGHLLAVSFSPQRFYLPRPTSGWASEGREMMGKPHLWFSFHLPDWLHRLWH